VPEAVVLQAPAVQTPEEVALATPTSTAVPTSTEVLTATQAPTATPEATAQPTAQATRPPTPTPTPAVEVRTIGAIGVEDVGRRLAIAEAGIAGIDYFSRGVQYTLTDPTGSIVLLVWQNVLEGLADRYDLFPGSRVRVAGEIDQYEGLLEIVPRDGVDVAVLARGDRAPVEERTVTAITPSDEGRIFIVEGAVTRVEGEPWRRVWLADGTGEILVYVPQRAVPYLPAGIGPGVKLRVTGEVDIYQGTLEVIPLAGADVEVR
jgi:DNA/RNA endonuclease YhcR with UshA esterase domain